MITKTMTEAFLDKYLEDYSFEEILEMFDVSVYEVFEMLYDQGQLDPELLERLQ